jgi:glycosyltransferase involved in cell wall biosynthesis
MESGLVSVVVPTYNRAYCICRAIDSVRAQTYSNWEVVIVDDGSKDDTAAVISSKYGDDPRVRYIYQANTGVTGARNKGIRESRGDYVAFLDSDDVWKPWKLETQVACFKRFPEVGMVFTEFEAVNAAGDVVMNRGLKWIYEAYNYFQPSESLWRTSCALTDIVKLGDQVEPGARVFVGNLYVPMLRGNLVHTSTTMSSLARIEKVGGFDEGLAVSGEDYDFHFRTCKWGDVCFIDAQSTEYQLAFDDRLSQFKMKLAENFLKTVQKAVERERGTDTFPPAMVHEVLAEAHAWIAEEMYKAGDYPGLRKQALLSLKHKINQPRLFALFAVSLVPRSVFTGLLPVYRKVKSTIRGGKGAGLKN